MAIPRASHFVALTLIRFSCYTILIVLHFTFCSGAIMFNRRNLPLRSSHSRKQRSLYRTAIEFLEPRQLMTVDITGAFTTFPSLPLLAGTKQNVVLQLTNGGNTKATGSLAIDLYATLDGETFDPETSRSLGRVNASASMNPNATQNVNIPLLFSPALAAGDYRINAVIDSLNKIAETDENNNVAESSLISITQPNYDLVPAFGTRTIPASLVEGDTVAGTAQVIISNPSASSLAIAAGVNVAVQIFARPDGAIDDASDVLINKSAVSAAVGGLAAGKTKAASVPLSFAGLTAGNYTIVAKIDTGDALAETDENNNEVVLGATTVTVNPRTTNLTLTVNSGTKFPAGAIVFNGTTKFPLKFDVAVSGNRPNQASEKINIQILAHPHDGLSPDIEVQTFSNIVLGAVQPGKFKTVTVTPTLPFGGSSGDYDFIAVLTTPISSDNSTDNTATTTITPLHIERGFYDLQAAIASSTIPTAIVEDVPKNGVVKVDITNVGNVALPAVQRVNIALALRPADAGDDSQDLAIGQLNNQSVAKLAPNAKKTFSVNGTVSELIGSDEYFLVAKMTPVDAITEELLANNSASGATITVAPAFVNLDIATATETFANNVLGGAKANGVVTIANLGNVPAVGSVNVQFFATTTGGIDDGVNIGEKSFPLNLLNGKTSSNLTVALTLPTGPDTNTYTIIAKIVPTGFTDTNSSDNTQTAAGTVIAAPATVDIHLASATHSFASNALGGATGTGIFTIDNLGTVPASGNVTVTYYATTASSLNADASNGTAIGATTLTNLSIGANGGVSAAKQVALTLPNPNSTTSLKIFARITAGSGITDNNTANNDTAQVGIAVSTAHYTTPFPLTHGNTFTFKSTSSGGGFGIFFDSGTFTTNVPGITGTYYMTYGPSAVNSIAITYDNPNPIPGYGVALTYNVAHFKFGGKTLTFSFDPTGAKGTGNVSGNTAYFK
jgi:hypothetical protein